MNYLFPEEEIKTDDKDKTVPIIRPATNVDGEGTKIEISGRSRVPIIRPATNLGNEMTVPVIRPATNVDIVE